MERRMFVMSAGCIQDHCLMAWGWVSGSVGGKVESSEKNKYRAVCVCDSRWLGKVRILLPYFPSASSFQRSCKWSRELF